MKKISLFIVCCLLFVGCANDNGRGYNASTPTVDYVEDLDVYSASHQDKFLNALAMNYRSYAIYNARTSGFPDVGEQFASKAMAAFAGDTPFPESLADWAINDDAVVKNLRAANTDLLNELKADAPTLWPELAAEAQAKFDCWVSASATGQIETANECQSRFEFAISELVNCRLGKKSVGTKKIINNIASPNEYYYPQTMRYTGHGAPVRESTVIINNVNVPMGGGSGVPMVFNQNIFADKNGVENCAQLDDSGECLEVIEVIEETTDRDEFIEMMIALRGELAVINARLDELEGGAETTLIKVQQIPTESKQSVMEEVFEIKFDFDKAIIKPEYEDLINKLADAAKNKNVKVSVVGHTDTMGSKAYNYALGGRRAEAVQKMLVKYGIPKSKIIAVSKGENDLKVQTGDNVAKSENRRVQVIKETGFIEPVPRTDPMYETIVVEETVQMRK